MTQPIDHDATDEAYPRAVTSEEREPIARTLEPDPAGKSAQLGARASVVMS